MPSIIRGTPLIGAKYTGKKFEQIMDLKEIRLFGHLGIHQDRLSLGQDAIFCLEVTEINLNGQCQLSHRSARIENSRFPEGTDWTGNTAVCQRLF